MCEKSKSTTFSYYKFDQKISTLKKCQNCFVRITARPTKLGKKGELGGEEEDEEEDITILLTSRWVEDIILSYKNFFENALMGVGAFQN